MVNIRIIGYVSNDALISLCQSVIRVRKVTFSEEPLNLGGAWDGGVAPGSGDFGPCGTGLCATNNFTADRRTTEDSQAVYVQLNMATELADRPVNMRLGLRYETTDVTSTALSPNYTELNWNAGNELHHVTAGRHRAFPGRGTRGCAVDHHHRSDALRRFDALTQKTTELPVVVSWDRRQAERRRTAAKDTVERWPDVLGERVLSFLGVAAGQ